MPLDAIGQTLPDATNWAKYSNERLKVRSASSGKQQAGSSRMRRW